MLVKTKQNSYFQQRLSGLFNMLVVVLILLSIFAMSGCQKPQPVVKKKVLPRTKLSIFALQDIRDSGFESAVLKDFAQQNNTELQLTLFQSLPEMLTALHSDEQKGKADVVMGIDSAFALSDSLLDVFSPISEVSLSEISFEINKDPAKRLIPYATANLAIIYNSKQFPKAPESFGELQDSRFYSQLALCDPETSGLGRGGLYWSAALFGDSGFDQFWNSLRKNVRKVYSTQSEALNAVRKGECALMLGYHSTPAWIEEFYPSENHIKAVIPQEGSFQYVESAAIAMDAPNRVTAVKFLQFLISPATQKFVMYKLGMMPVNGRTPLPRRFEALPLSVYTLNSRLNRGLAKESLGDWLDRWQSILVQRPGI